MSGHVAEHNYKIAAREGLPVVEITTGFVCRKIPSGHLKTE